MTFQLHPEGSGCLYEQIYEHIRKEIKEGKLLAGERLPSTRALAEYLQVARSTVDYAYGQLLSEGYINPGPARVIMPVPWRRCPGRRNLGGKPGRRRSPAFRPFPGRE